MTVYNAMLNIASTAVAVTESEEETTEPSTTEPETQSDEDNYIDYEVISESVDTSQTYMRTSSTYDSNNNYEVTSIDEAGHQLDYTYDIDGNVTSYLCGNGDETTYEYDNAGNVTKIKKYDAQNLYSYNSAGYISEIQHNNFSYTFNYDVFNRLISSKIGNTALSSNTYTNGNLTRTTYANGDFIEYTYDDYDNIVDLEDESGTFARFVYNKKGKVTVAEDIISQDHSDYYYYYYDFAGNQTNEYRQTNNGILSYNISYDSDGNTVEKTSVGNAVKTIIRGTDDNGSFVSNDGVRVNSESDNFGRTTKITTSNSNNNIQLHAEYTYLDGTDTNSTTKLANSLTQKLGDNQLVKYTYDYDDNNNIIQAYEVDGNNNSNQVVDYEYDGYNQFQREIDYINNTYTYYHYDNAGNITGVDKYAYDPMTNLPTTLLSQKTYEYGDNVWKDKLTKFNGTAITYDESGNPINYRNGMSISWIRGRVLDKITINNSDIQMRYDSNGLRTQKGNVRYYYDSNNNLIALSKGSTTLFFHYDENGNPTSFSDGTNMYYYVKNIQGDIVKIVNSAGAVVANYAYNVWGELLYIKDAFGNSITDTSSIVFLNPLRYRGYVYDDETGLYYLQSRYYDPVTCRFINADIYCETKSGTPFSTNMYAYCENNAVNRTDHTGSDYFWYYDLWDYNQALKNTYKFYELHKRIGNTKSAKSYLDLWKKDKDRIDKIKRTYTTNKFYFGNYNNYIFGQRHHNNGYPYLYFYRTINIPFMSMSWLGSTSVETYGCGVVAIYNVMSCFTNHVNLAQIIFELDMNKQILPSSGLVEGAITRYFQNHSIRYKIYYDYQDYTKNKKKHTIAMIFIENHVYCIIKIRNSFYTLNRHGYDSGFIRLKESDLKDNFWYVWEIYT